MFEGQKAVIIGGTSGIGLAAAVELSRAGEQVWVTGRTADKVAAAGRQNRAYLDGANRIYCRLAPAHPSFCSPLRAHAHGSE